MATPRQRTRRRVTRDRRRSAHDVDERARSLVLRPNTLNEEARTVDAVLATEAPVLTAYLSKQGAVLESIRMDGAELPEQMPLVDTHNRTTVRNQFGSVRNLRIENGELIGTLHFSSTADREWTMAREGHLTDVSLGYRVLDGVTIPAGKTMAIRGRSYTAPPSQPLIVVTAWQGRELSLTSVGADSRTKLRSEPSTSSTEGTTMNERLRAYLVSIGLRSDATDEQVQAFYDSLSDEARTRADAAASQPAPNANGRQRSEPVTPAAPPATPPIDENRIRSEAAAAERTRQATIRDMAVEGVPADMVRQAIDEGWEPARASQAFLTALRDSRSQAPSAGPGIHTRSHEGDCTRDVLGAALMLREGVALDIDYRGRSAATLAMRMPEWMRADVDAPERQRVMDTAWRFRDASLVDICREAVRMDGGRPSMDREEMIRSAVSGSSLSAIFTTNVSAQLLGGYTEAPDSTMGWVAESDVPNFLDDERASMGKFGSLTKHTKGGSAEHMATSDSKETSRIARYSGQFVVDEMDIINDRFGAIEQLSPREIGFSAAALRPDLVYAILLANAALDADSTALFHADHNNVTTTALAAAALQTAIAAMAKQRINNRPLNVRPRYLIVPQDLGFTARTILQSAERMEDSGEGSFNPLRDLGITPVIDDRVGVAGVTDPTTGTAYAGSATKWFLAARPGEAGAKTLVVKYRRGTGRAPQLRSFMLSQGQWGVGWDINHDIGADADDFRGLFRGNT